MSSKRNHAARSRKTHHWNMIGARQALRGSLPYELRRDMSRALRQIRAAKAAPPDDKEQKEET